jgi:DNA-binding HxlR family transcriptional regulator
MPDKKGYQQYCPISVAAEVIAERWTPLVLRSFFCGASRFNEIHKSVPRMSTALLSSRLKELEYAKIIEQVPSPHTRGKAYRLTEAGQELFAVLDQMGTWAQRWLRRDITSDENLDPDILMWELRQVSLMAERKVESRRVVQFQLSGVPVEKRSYWLVFEPEDTDICVRDPGHEVDLWITAHFRTLIEIWLGHKTIAGARRDESLRLEGNRAEIKAFTDWFALSHFAKAGAEPARELPGA